MSKLIFKLIQFFTVFLISVVVYSAPPANLYSPNNNQTEVSITNPNFSWSKVAGATAYRIVISTKSDFSNFNDTGSSTSKCIDDECITEGLKFATSYHGANLKPLTTYYWKVRSDKSQWSSVSKFTTKTGSVRVTLNPAEIRDKAKFQVVGWLNNSNEWWNSGQIKSGLTDDEVTIKFSDVNGWKTPSDKTVSVKNLTDVSATYTKEETSIDGQCGSADGHIFSATDTGYGRYSQCSSGKPNNTSFPRVGGSVNWICSGENGGSSVNCSASREAEKTTTATITSIDISPTSGVADTKFTVTAQLSEPLKAGEKVYAQFGYIDKGWIAENSDGGHRQLLGAGKSYSYSDKLSGVGSRKVRVGIFDSNDKLVGSYSSSKNFTISPPEATITSIDITPKSGVAGTEFTVTAYLSEILKAGQKLYAQFGDTINGWLSEDSDGGHRLLTGSGKSYSYSGSLTGVGSRKVRVGIFDINEMLVGHYSDSKNFTISEKVSNPPVPPVSDTDEYHPVGKGFRYANSHGDSYSKLGIGGINDRYARDVNYGSGYDDEGKPVYAVESGRIIKTEGWGGKSFGQLLIEHKTKDGVWYSGYLHMKNITQKSYVNKGEVIGKVSHVYGLSLSTLGNSVCKNPQSGKTTMCPHLHFAKYKRNSKGVLYSIYYDPKNWKYFKESGNNPVVSGSAPQLKNTKNLPECKTSPSEKCVKADTEVQLNFSISDSDNDLKQVEINWDGMKSPEDVKGISGGSGSIVTKHTFSYNDLKDCSSNPEYRIDGVCWKKDITVTATAYDNGGNESNVFKQLFTLYDLNKYNAIKDGKVITDKNKEIAKQKEIVKKVKQDVNNKTKTCSQSKVISADSNEPLKPLDPFRKNPKTGDFEYQRKYDDKITEYQCSDHNENCVSELRDFINNINNDYLSFNPNYRIKDLNFNKKSFVGKDYKIVTTYNYKDENEHRNTSYPNYPAKVVSSFLTNGRWRHYETKYVNNYEEKSKYIQAVTYRLKEELIARTSNSEGLAKCQKGDYDEWLPSELEKRVRANDKFDDTVNAIVQETGGNREDIARAVADGVADATREIVKEYGDTITNLDDTIGGLLSFVKKAVTDPVGAGKEAIQTAEALSKLAIDIANNADEITRGLADAVASWDTYQKAYYTSYISTHIAHEFAPTSKLKLLKGKMKIPAWLDEAVVLVRLNKTGYKIPKKDLDSLTDSYKKQIKKYLDDKDSLLTDEPKELASNISGSSTSSNKKEWLKNFWRGNAFNKRRMAEKPNWKHELYLCKFPNGCDKNPKEYVRLDSYDDTVSPPRIISRKHTQLAEVNPETAKGYIKELANKYKADMKVPYVESTINGTDKNPTTKGMAGKVIQGQQVLEIPRQDKPIPKEIQDYADSFGILIVEAD